MTFGKKNKGGANIDHCCSAKPFVNCHYKDKPSKIPCKDSEPIDKNGRSFWQRKKKKKVYINLFYLICKFMYITIYVRTAL